MKPLTVLAFAVAAANGLAACASPSPPAAAGHHGPEVRSVDLPAAPGSGQPREVRVLVDEPGLKLATIVLRAGTKLPTHHSAAPVTIAALHGSGTVVAGTERLRLDATHAVVLGAGVPHAVEPEPGTDLVLLVHHLGRGEDHHP